MVLMIGAVIVGVAVIVLLVLASANPTPSNDLTIGSPFRNIVKSL